MSSSLQSISLITSDTEHNELIQLLETHKDQLRTLKLRQVRMAVYEAPEDLTLRFLRFLKEDLSLTCLSIDDFSVEDMDYLEPRMVLLTFGEELVCDGREEVDEGLETLIEEIKKEYRDEL
jgi:hypothetical protein